MKKWFVHLDFGVVGCGTHVLIEAETEEEAIKLAYEDTIEWAQSYGYEQNDEHFGTLDELGCDWNEEDGDYEQQGFVDPSVELYDPALHDGYLY